MVLLFCNNPDLMKKSTLALLVLITSCTVSFAQFANPQKGHYQCYQRKSQQGVLPVRNQLSPNAPRHAYDVLNYSIDLDLMNNYSAPYPASFSANVTIRFRMDSIMNVLALDAVNSSLLIDSVGLAGTGFNHEDDLLSVTLDRTYLPGEEAEVKIYYHHKNINDGAIYVSGGFLFTDCEPEGARRWFPCYDDPSDKATVEVKAKVPSNVKLGSNGRLQDSIPGSNFITYHWISRDPVATYLVVLSSKVNYNLDIVNWTNPNTSEVIPIRFYYNDNENPGPIMEIIGEMTDYFSTHFGDHPFEKNGFATLNGQFTWAGMENQTLTSLCPGCWQEWLIAHEYAHQWFGDMITCATWADIFLNEGFATWAEAFWNEHTQGYDTYMDEMKGNANYYLSSNPGWAISDPDWAVNTPGSGILFNYAVTYMKGSCVMHQLRFVLGDSLFFTGLKAYATDTVDFKYQSATIPDFRDKMESVTGVELDWFFDGWIYQPNHPNYKNVYQIKPLQDGKWRVTFTARQQDAATYYWQMPLELRISFMDLTDTIVKVFNSFHGQIFTFDFDRQPANLQFDPGHNILLRQGSTIVSDEESIAAEPALFLAMPTVFSGQTTIRYSLSHTDHVEFTLLDARGKEVMRQMQPNLTAGEHHWVLEGENLASGMYFLQMRTGDGTRVLKLVRK